MSYLTVGWTEPTSSSVAVPFTHQLLVADDLLQCLLRCLWRPQLGSSCSRRARVYLPTRHITLISDGAFNAQLHSHSFHVFTHNFSFFLVWSTTATLQTLWLTIPCGWALDASTLSVAANKALFTLPGWSELSLYVMLKVKRKDETSWVN